MVAVGPYREVEHQPNIASPSSAQHRFAFIGWSGIARPALLSSRPNPTSLMLRAGVTCAAVCQ